jgi:diguanylate cyclase (GGDEF)-like protein
MERLYESTREIERPRGHRASIQALLDQTLDLLSGDTAELTLLGTAEHPALVLVSGRDRFFEELPSDLAGRIATERMAELSESEGEATPDADETFAGYDEQTAAQMKRQVITAPLQSPSGLVGSLRVSMNYGVTFSDADRHLLEMFANHASVALHNSRLIDQLRAEIAEREHQALHDDLTSLPNRVMFDLQTRQALDRRAPGELIAVILVDLDRFKEVNDTLGHDRGDELLERLGSRIAEVGVARSLTVARLGGDEFAVLLRAAKDEADVQSVAASVRLALETPIEIAGVLVDVRASLGVAIAPTDGDDATTLLQRADVAMYIAKSRHHGVAFYERETDPYSPERLSLAADLRHAVAHGDVQPHFQPVTSLVTGEPISVEALARWTHPNFGVVPPDVFIPIAEQSGLIRELTYHILDKSLEQIRRWKNAGFELHVAVNLSVRLLADDDLVTNIARHLDLAGVAPDMLTLEVTEGTIMADPERAIAILEDLHALGVSLSIDDFGMGYSSLNLLKRMPVSQLKIDRSFVTALPSDRDDAVIVESVVHLGHNLGMQVVAEGVEDLAALEHLRSIGCDSVQGFYLSPALPPAELLRWLRRRPQFSPAAIALR